MTKEEKQLLFKVLCTMLPYRIKCKASHGLGNTNKKHEYIGVLKFVGNCYGVIANYYEDVPHDTGLINNVFYDIEYIKPYLRPMSSMTEEEKTELCTRAYAPDDMKTLDEKLYVIQTNAKNAADFYNEHHLDYRGLIPMGLAIEAPKDMYK